MLIFGINRSPVMTSTDAGTVKSSEKFQYVVTLSILKSLSFPPALPSLLPIEEALLLHDKGRSTVLFGHWFLFVLFSQPHSPLGI